jgi:hypothetical protein
MNVSIQLDFAMAKFDFFWKRDITRLSLEAKIKVGELLSNLHIRKLPNCKVILICSGYILPKVSNQNRVLVPSENIPNNAPCVSGQDM